MLVRLFRSNQSGILLALLVLVPLLFLKHVQAPLPVSKQMMPAFGSLVALFGMASWVQGVVLMFTIVLVSVQLTSLVNDADLMDQRNHLPALLFPILLAAQSPPGSIGSALYGLPFLIGALHRSWSIKSGGAALGALFDAGFLIGVAAQFYMPYSFLVVVVWASVSVIRPFLWREYLVPLMGLAICFYLTWGMLFLTGHGDWEPLRTVVHVKPVTLIRSAGFHGMYFLLLTALFVFSLFGFARQYTKGVVREQNLRSAFIAFVVTMGVVIGLVSLLNGWYPSVLLAMPLALLFTFALLGKKRLWAAETAVFALLVLALWMQYGG